MPEFFWEAVKRERIHSRVVLEVNDNIVEPTYERLSDEDMTDLADNTGERIKDNVWANVPGEGSA